MDELPPAILEFASTTEDIRENMRRFARDVAEYQDRSRNLVSQTTYWVFDEDVEEFGPSKFVGFRAMSFVQYELAVKGHSTGERFGGELTRAAIENVLGSFVPDDLLADRLKVWCRSRLGSETLDGISIEKWRFTRLTPARNYLSVVCDPDVYAGLEACAALDELSWVMNRSTKNPRPGDRVLVWQAKGSTGRRGVIAMAEVIQGRTLLKDSPEEHGFYRNQEPNELQDRIKIRLIRFPNLPLWESDMPELAQLNAAKARGGTVFELSPDQWHAIATRAGNSKAANTDVVREPADRQGYTLSPAARRAVELHAQQMAEDYFTSLGYVVADVSRRKPYDLHCTKPAEEIRVEVKGTTGNGEAVFLTRNEVDHAREHADRVVLVIVRQIELEGAALVPVARGGVMQIIRPWTVEEHDLRPIQYEYSVPTVV